MTVVAGVDLGGTAVNYTLVNQQEKFLIDGMCEHPALVKQGPEVCLRQIADGLKIAADKAGVLLSDVVAVGLDTPGPASAAGQLSTRGATNFVHPHWAGFDIREGLAQKIGKPVSYLNDANAAAIWGHYSIFGANSRETSISAAIERNLLPYFLPRYPGHELAKLDPHQAAKLVRGLADKGDALCKDIFRVQAHALGLFFDEMVNIFDPDALIVGGGALEASKEFQQWFLNEIRVGMPTQREEQANIPIYVMPNGDTAGARGAAIEALKLARQSGLM